MNGFFDAWAPRILSVLRVIAGFMLLWHGSQKLFDVPSTGKAGSLSGLMLTAGILEFFGGILLIIGLFTRPVAFVLSGLMAVAYFIAHASAHFLPLVNRGELAALYCFVFFYMFFAGGGPWSVDALIGKNKPEQA